MVAACVIAVALLLGMPAVASAQSTSGAIWSSLPPIGLPLPDITPSLPPIGLSPIGVPLRVDRPTTPPPGRPDGPKDGGRHRPRPGLVFVTPPYPWYYAEPVPAPAPAVTERPAPLPLATGRLRFDVQPAAGVQLFVDGEFVGMLEEVGGELDLAAGSRRIEMRAPGFNALTFDARIAADRTITYRGALVPESGAAIEVPVAAPEPPAPPEPQTFYVIRGCYMGNIPPQQVRLPAGCDPGQVTIYRPDPRPKN